VTLVKTAHVDGIDLAYEISGQGEPLLLVHGSNLATGLVPLAAALGEPAPSVQTIRYHRRGMTGSTGRAWPVSIARQAADLLGLLDVLRLDSAHVLGYSSGAVIALEAALFAPDRIRSLTLLEPILTEVPSWSGFSVGMAPILALYEAGDMAGAAHATFAGMAGPNWRQLIATAGPGALELAERDTEVFYRAEFPALSEWTLDAQRATALSAPVLSVVGDHGEAPFFAEGRALLHQHFPHCQDADIPGADHMMHLQAPGAIAAAVSGFALQS
jgi:pimeloyl-ACP methyl ester carboxylesterase